MSGQTAGDRPAPERDEARDTQAVQGTFDAHQGADAVQAAEAVQAARAVEAQSGQSSPGFDCHASQSSRPVAVAVATATGARHTPGTSPGVVGGGAAAAESERAVAAQAGVKLAAEQHSGRVHQIEPDEHSPLIALTGAISANFRRALLATVLACVGLGLTYSAGGMLNNTPARFGFFNKHTGIGHAAAMAGAALFLVFGVIAVRSATGEILKTVPSSLGDNRKNGLRWVCLLVGYLVVIFGTLGALNVPVERLLLGGAVTGVILGIAAQQSLGNLFAGLMLLLTRPFAIGDEISLRSGALGGVLTGLVADMNLTYVKLVTDNGTVLLPNASILSAVVGPPGVFG